MYLRALSRWPAEELRFACVRAAEETVYTKMPLPAELINYARQYRRPAVRVELSRTALDHTTSYNSELGNQAVAKVMAMFSDWGDLPDKNRGKIPSKSAAQQRAEFYQSESSEDVEEKKCPYCYTVLVQREDEPDGNFKARRYCNKRCKSLHQSERQHRLKRKQRVDTV